MGWIQMDCHQRRLRLEQAKLAVLVEWKSIIIMVGQIVMGPRQTGMAAVIVLIAFAGTRIASTVSSGQIVVVTIGSTGVGPNPWTAAIGQGIVDSAVPQMMGNPLDFVLQNFRC